MVTKKAAPAKKTSPQKQVAKKKAAPAKKKAVASSAPKRASKPSEPAKKKPGIHSAAKKADAARANTASGPTEYAGLATVWSVNTGAQTVGLWLDEHVWTGNDRGECFKFDRASGKTLGSWALPGECVAVVSDEAWKYAGCDNGCVYDLTGSVPRVAYQLGGARHDWLEVNQGVLCVSDNAGTVSVIDVDGSIRWQKSDKKATEAWVLRTAADGLYHGSMAGLRKYDWSGKLLWKSNPGDVRFGVIDGDDLFVTAGFNKKGYRTELARVARATGETRWATPFRAQRDYYSNGAEAAAVGRSKDGARRIYAALSDRVFCFDEDGALLWLAPTHCGSICNMALDGDRLYFGTSSGAIACADVSEAALAAVLAEGYRAPRSRAQSRVKAKKTSVERTRAVGKGVLVECVKDGSKLRVRVLSKGYHSDWFCQFPRDIREAGAKYVVDEVREATQGGFYRVLGDIKRLDE